MYSAFQNLSFQKQFERKGYVLLSSLLSEGEVKELYDLFERFQSQFSGPFHTTHFSKDLSYKKEVHDSITSIVFPRVATHLNHFVPLFGNFMIKNAGAQTSMDLHADWTYVDEQRHSSAAVWIPLVDVNEENGCLGVIEGSHKVTNSIRGPMIRQSSRQKDDDWAKRYGKLIPMKAGDAIVYDHRLLHYSPSNKTTKIRPALNLSMAPETASWLHYCLPEGAKEIELYAVPDSSFYLHYNNFQRPETGALVKTLPSNTEEYIDARMEQFWKTSMLNKIKQLF